VEIPARYGCANCAGEFFVKNALAWKRATDPNRCPHCRSRKVLPAIEVEHGAVIVCNQCGQLGLFEQPGFEGTITVEDVKAAGKLTEEAMEFFGGLGFRFEVNRAKARRAAANVNARQLKSNHKPLEDKP
jgi:DNA-directed RNA polymerase subunit RPC12/RpoP